jgi:pyocin large subunit-like protein
MDDFLKRFQILYSEIKIYEDIRYNLEVELYNKYKKGLPPTTSFTQKTFKWPNPKYELDEQVSIKNTIDEMNKYITDVQDIMNDIKKKLI